MIIIVSEYLNNILFCFILYFKHFWFSLIIIKQ